LRQTRGGAVLSKPRASCSAVTISARGLRIAKLARSWPDAHSRRPRREAA
jgi:hypothetical protein